MRTKFILLTLALAVLASQAQATTYNLANDFITGGTGGASSAQSGPWRYGYSSKTLDQYTLNTTEGVLNYHNPDALKTLFASSEITPYSGYDVGNQQWYGPDTLNVWKNSGSVSLHPANSYFSLVEWTQPADGLLTITASFGEGYRDTANPGVGDMSYVVYTRDSSGVSLLATWLDEPLGQTYSLNDAFSASGTVYGFAVGPRLDLSTRAVGGYTPLSLDIALKPVPIPGAALLLAPALLGLVGFRRKFAA